LEINEGKTSKQDCEGVIRKKRTRKVCLGANQGAHFKIEELVGVPNAPRRQVG